MATFAIGDIHGNRPALEDVLEQIAGVLTPEDTVVFLGDYIDRGVDSKGCVDRILELRRSTPAEVIALRGNHEDWLLRTSRDFTFHSWILGMDAWETIRSYSPVAAEALVNKAKTMKERLYQDKVPLPYELFFDAVPADHMAFFQALTTYHRTADCLCVHAGFDPQAGPIEQQDPRSHIWGVRGVLEKYSGPEIVVYGHWNNALIREDGWPLPNIDTFTIGVDTSKHGVVTAVQMPERRVFQSAQYL